MNRYHSVVLVMLIVLASSTYALVNETISYDNTQILENQSTWLNITFDSPNVYDRLIYNNTVFSTTKTTNATHTKLVKQLNTPRLNKDTNISFLWEYNSVFDNNFWYNINDLVNYWSMDSRKTDTNNLTSFEQFNLFLYDDFEDGSINTNKWNNFTSESNGELNLIATSAQSFHARSKTPLCNLCAFIFNVSSDFQGGSATGSFMVSPFPNATNGSATTLSSNKPASGFYAMFRNGNNIILYNLSSGDTKVTDASNTGDNMYPQFLASGAGGQATFNFTHSYIGNFSSELEFNNTVVKRFAADNRLLRNDGVLTAYTFNHGELTNVIINDTFGKYGKGAGFDGAGDTIIIGDVPELENNKEFTISTWYKPSAIGVAGAIAETKNKGFIFDFLSNNKVRFGAYNSSGSLTILTSTNAIITPVNTWIYLAGSIDKSGNIKLYVNGINTDNITHTGWDFMDDLHTATYIGSNQDAEKWINGSLDSFRFWNKSLTYSEIKSDFNNQTKYTPIGDELTLSYSFENNNASHTYDENNIVTNTFRPDLGEANHFDGFQDYINIDDYVFTNKSTLSWWAKISRKVSTGIVSGQLGNFAFLRYGQGAGQENQNIFGETNTNGDNIDLDFTNPNTINYNQWYHFSIVTDSKNSVNNWSLYINGAFQSSDTTTNSKLNISAIGMGRNNADWFNGSIDDVLIFNRSLSSTEIGYLFNHTFHTNSTTNEQQIFFWDLDNCSTYTTSAFDFEIRDETTDNPILANVSFVYNFFNDLDGTFNKQYSKIMLNRNNYSFCKTPSFVNLTGGMSHTVSSGTHETRNFIRSNVAYTGTFISYLVQISATVQTVLFKIVDTTLASVEGAVMQFTKVINSIPTVVATEVSDFAGQVSLPLDSTTTYQIQLNASGFPLKIFNLKPALSSYTIRLNATGDELFSNNYEGIRYRITPPGRTFNISNNFINFTFELDGSNLEYFGLNFSRHNFECIPTNCQNISTSSTGGKVTVKIKVNSTSRFYTNLFFKVEGKDQVNINSWPNDGVIFFKAARSAITLLDEIKQDVGPMTLAILAAFIQVVIIGIAVQVGVAGIPLIMIGAISVMILSIPQIGLINPVFGIFIAIAGFIMYGILAMVSNQ